VVTAIEPVRDPGMILKQSPAFLGRALGRG
jgi:hypothetical protein